MSCLRFLIFAPLLVALAFAVLVDPHQNAYSQSTSIPAGCDSLVAISPPSRAGSVAVRVQFYTAEVPSVAERTSCPGWSHGSECSVHGIEGCDAVNPESNTCYGVSIPNRDYYVDRVNSRGFSYWLSPERARSGFVHYCYSNIVIRSRVTYVAVSSTTAPPTSMTTEPPTNPTTNPPTNPNPNPTPNPDPTDPSTPNPTPPGPDGPGGPDAGEGGGSSGIDSDGDGVPDEEDPDPTDPNISMTVQLDELVSVIAVNIPKIPNRSTANLVSVALAPFGAVASVTTSADLLGLVEDPTAFINARLLPNLSTVDSIINREGGLIRIQGSRLTVIPVVRRCPSDSPLLSLPRVNLGLVSLAAVSLRAAPVCTAISGVNVGAMRSFFIGLFSLIILLRTVGILNHSIFRI